MSQKRNMPTRQKIADYWTSKEGLDHILRIRDTYNVDVGDMLCIEHDIPHCWACDVTMVEVDSSRDGSTHKRYNEPYIGLDRCHVIPKAVGGPDTVDNLVLMCERCHTDSPNTESEKIFWTWFTNRPDGRHYQPSTIAYNALRPEDQSLLFEYFNGLSSKEDLENFKAMHGDCYDKVLDESGAVTALGKVSHGTRCTLSSLALDMMLRLIKDEIYQTRSAITFKLEDY